MEFSLKANHSSVKRFYYVDVKIELFSSIRMSHFKIELSSKFMPSLTCHFEQKYQILLKKILSAKIFQPTLKCTFLSETELPIKSCTWRNITSPNLHIFICFLLSELGL